MTTPSLAQSNMEDVFTVLKSCKPYYVRCIKSNSSQTPGYFDKEAVQHQIQYLAVFETVDLIQTGKLPSLSACAQQHDERVGSGESDETRCKHLYIA